YAQLEERTKKLTDGLDHLTTQAGIPHQIQRVGSMWTLFFIPDPVIDYESAKKCDTSRFGRFFWAMMDRGIYLPCSQFEAAFVSIMHADKHIDQTLDAAREALAEVG